MLINPDPRAVSLDNKNYKNFPLGINDLTPAADPFSTSLFHRISRSETAKIVFGRVVDAVPYARTYKVQLDGSHTAIACCDLSPTGLLPIGAKSIITYPPGAGVYVLIDPNANYGIIVGGVPDYIMDARVGISDFIVQGSRVGFKIDAVNAFPILLASYGNVTDWSASRPFDSITIGEWGAITETGLGFFLDPFLAFMRVDETTGLFLFYHDQLARLAGYNFQLRTAGSEREDFDDQNEYSQYEGYASYVWEARGRSWPGADSFLEFSPAAQQITFPVVARYEPFYSDRQPFHRLMTFHGYLGQIESRFVSLLPDVGPFRESIVHVLPGVFEEHISQAGQYVLRSVKGVTIGKTSVIAVPKRMKHPEDPTGDTVNNYKFCSIGGSGKTHKITDRIPLPAVFPYLYEEFALRASALLDQIAYQFNWEALHPFHYHSLDWYVSEEWQIPNFSAGSTAPTFNLLTNYYYLPPPYFTDLYVDHRYGYGRFYATEALLNFLEDGSVVLTDGYGFELRSVQGNVFLSVPGDIWLMPGRNTNIWSGWDTIIKSQNSTDISSSIRDVRIKAERNMQLLSGNSGCGCLLLENRGFYNFVNFTDRVGEDILSTGIILKSRTSYIAQLSPHILISTNLKKYTGEPFENNDPLTNTAGEFMGGSIVLDAAHSSIVSYSRVFFRRISAFACDSFFQPDKSWLCNVFFGKENVISGDLAIKNSLSVSKNIVAQEDVSILGDFVNKNGGLIKKFKNGPNDLENHFNEVSNTINTYSTKAQAWRIGRELIQNGDMNLAEFSFRTTQQYKTEDLRIYELRWHQLARLSGQVLPVWQEKASAQTGQSDNPPLNIYRSITYPYPGRQAWTGEGDKLTYFLENLYLYDPGSNMKAPRQVPGLNKYETAELNLPTGQTLLAAYRVLMNPLL
ncbi:MAG: hypothetical protein KatS3mg035_1782 [Bacteroidia bacterium]|nr:MAG: hypothetical protein KatS3mg035_1782 [Bacteroidia bacterium]